MFGDAPSDPFAVAPSDPFGAGPSDPFGDSLSDPFGDGLPNPFDASPDPFDRPAGLQRAGAEATGALPTLAGGGPPARTLAAARPVQAVVAAPDREPAPSASKPRAVAGMLGGAVLLALLVGGGLFVARPGEASNEQLKQHGTLVLLGDSLMTAGDYEAARAPFTAALELRPNDGYVQQRLEQVDRLVSAEHMLAQKQDEQHRRLIAQGDSLLHLLQEVGASDPLLAEQIRAATREAYLRALVYRPHDEAVRERLTRLAQPASAPAQSTAPAAGPDPTLEAERARLRQQQLVQYETAVREGDRFLSDGNYLEAQIRFREALIFQPEDTYAAGRLEMIDALWQERSRSERYDAYLKRGDQLVQGRLYEQARSAYAEALTVRPGDALVLARIEASRRQEQEAQNRLAEQRQRREQYEQALADGLALVSAGRYPDAVAHYTQALRAYPGDPHLTDELSAARKALGQNTRTDEHGVYKFLLPEEQPRMIGSLQALYAQIKYPTSAAAARLEGRVFVQFVVDEQGNVQDPQILRGLSPDCDREVIRAIRTIRFEPARVDGRLVRAYHTVYVDFKL